MSILTPSEQKAQTAVEKAVRTSYRSDAEIAMREVLEGWCRTRYPDSRLFHELVMGRGTVRADLAAIKTDHLAAFEIKGPFDNTERLLHQIAMFRLAVPELWIVVAGRHAKDAQVIRHLLPSVGLLEIVHVSNAQWDASDQRSYRSAWQGTVDRTALRVEVIAEAEPFTVLPSALLGLCWVAELDAEAKRARLVQGSRNTHDKLATAMERLSPAEQMEAVCRQLRARETMFRADAPIRYWEAA